MQHQYSEREERLLFCDPNASGAAALQNGNDADRHVPSPVMSPAYVRSIIKARAKRREFFDQSLFSDPAWDMLLELYALKCEGVRISVSKLSVAAGVPCTTGLRWIDKLEADALISRSGDPLDRRRIWIELTDAGLEAMDAYLAQISRSELVL